MTEPPDAPPEGVLIKKAQAASELSQRAAAKRAGISETRWRQLVTGYTTTDGTKVRNRSPSGTLARMARAVKVTPEQLEAAGRPDAAAVLRETVEAEASQAQQREADRAFRPAGAESRVDERWHMLEAVLRQARVGLSSYEYDTLVARIKVFFEQSPDWQPPEEMPDIDGRRPGRPD